MGAMFVYSFPEGLHCSSYITHIAKLVTEEVYNVVADTHVPDTALARCPLTVIDGCGDMMLQVPQCLPSHGLVWGWVRSSANCFALTNFLLNDVPVRLTNLKIGRDVPALDDIGEPGVVQLVWEPDNPEKLLVLLSSGSNICTDSTNSWSLPNGGITRTAGSEDFGTRTLLFELSIGLRHLSKPLTFSLILSTIVLG